MSWKQIQEHHNNHKPPTSEKRPTTLLKLKWGIVKHDISKFVGCFRLVTTLNKLILTLKCVTK
jgi:hypothetical protein